MNQVIRCANTKPTSPRCRNKENQKEYLLFGTKSPQKRKEKAETTQM